MNSLDTEPLYLSANTALPPSARLATAIESGLADAWASVHDLHRAGRAARDVSEQSCRTLVRGVNARLGGALADYRWHFTTSFDLAMHSAVARVRHGVRRTTATVHYGAIETATVQSAARQAAETLCIGVSHTGRYDMAELTRALEASSSPCVLQTSNTEIGTRQDCRALRDMTTRFSAPWIADATGDLAYGGDIGSPDVVVGAASAWGGPSEVAFIAVAPHTPWVTTTEQAPLPQPSPTLLLGAAVSLQDASKFDGASAAAATAALRADLLSTIEGCDVAGDPEHTLPHILTASFLYCEGLRLVQALDRRGLLVGSGSACTNDAGVASHVLEATKRLSHGNVRIGIPPSLVPQVAQHHDRIVEGIAAAVTEIREDTGIAL